ncbi:unnamed protein product [Prorocentrum cordatum]|uniref:FAD assembly factor SdhE n=1 Tax=Prorocentrum cordatum TaxID=2364126 RepID=A0ABN9RQ49_9DINO|nr:unnamed protein product [Polarella glacialis]
MWSCVGLACRRHAQDGMLLALRGAGWAANRPCASGVPSRPLVVPGGGATRDGETSRHSAAGAAEDTTGAVAHPCREEKERARRQVSVDAPRQEPAGVIRKRLRHRARGRGWAEASEFLVGFFDSPFADQLDDEGMRALDRLMQCDDMSLMRFASGREAPEELQSGALAAVRKYFESCGPKIAFLAASLPP